MDIETPSDESFAIDDPALIHILARARRSTSASPHALVTVHDHCCPISLLSTQTAQQLGDEIGTTLDKRHFRTNIYLNLGLASGFAEDRFAGHTIRIGNKLLLAILECDPRCKMITFDPETANPNPMRRRLVATDLSTEHEQIIAASWMMVCRKT